MKVLLSWLQEFVDVPVEARKLADDLTLVGLAVDAVESLGTDTLLDLDITTNRVDCMNVPKDGTATATSTPTTATTTSTSIIVNPRDSCLRVGRVGNTLRVEAPATARLAYTAQRFARVTISRQPHRPSAF